MLKLEEFAAKIRQNDQIVVFTGAGMSTESGIPDFRSPGGIWTRYRPVTFQQYMASEAARMEAWKRRLDGWEQYKMAKPNVGHYFVQSLSVKEKLIGLITQNVDGLHSAAGVPDNKLVELHGSNRKILCMSCSKEFQPEPIINRLVGELQLVGDFASPKCDRCGGILKSATISFGQGLVARDLERAEQAALACDLLLAIGTTLGVYPIASMVPVAKSAGARIVIVNGDPTEMDSLADAVLRRLDLGTAGAPAPADLAVVGAVMARELGWDDARQRAEREALARFFERHGGAGSLLE